MVLLVRGAANLFWSEWFLEAAEQEAVENKGLGPQGRGRSRVPAKIGGRSRGAMRPLGWKGAPFHKRNRWLGDPIPQKN